jgi:hypothetical protein
MAERSFLSRININDSVKSGMAMGRQLGQDLDEYDLARRESEANARAQTIINDDSAGRLFDADGNYVGDGEPDDISRSNTAKTARLAERSAPGYAERVRAEEYGKDRRLQGLADGYRKSAQSAESHELDQATKVQSNTQRAETHAVEQIKTRHQFGSFFGHQAQALEKTPEHLREERWRDIVEQATELEVPYDFGTGEYSPEAAQTFALAMGAMKQDAEAEFDKWRVHTFGSGEGTRTIAHNERTNAVKDIDRGQHAGVAGAEKRGEIARSHTPKTRDDYYETYRKDVEQVFTDMVPGRAHDIEAKVRIWSPLEHSQRDKLRQRALDIYQKAQKANPHDEAAWPTVKDAIEGARAQVQQEWDAEFESQVSALPKTIRMKRKPGEKPPGGTRLKYKEVSQAAFIAAAKANFMLPTEALARFQYTEGK